jgi:hypothetical protein
MFKSLRIAQRHHFLRFSQAGNLGWRRQGQGDEPARVFDLQNRQIKLFILGDHRRWEDFCRPGSRRSDNQNNSGLAVGVYHMVVGDKEAGRIDAKRRSRCSRFLELAEHERSCLAPRFKPRRIGLGQAKCWCKQQQPKAPHDD